MIASFFSLSLIDRDLPINLGDRSQFESKSRYYISPDRWKEYTREYMLTKWLAKTTYVNESRDFKQAHPKCPIITKENADEFHKVTTYFTHKCCQRTGPPHNWTAYDYGQFDEVRHFGMSNISEAFHAKMDEQILGKGRGVGYWLWKPWIILDTIVR